MRRYNPKDIEPKWQKIWEDSKIYQATEDESKPKRYVLEYFPYPSGAAMHVGHVRNYTIGDVVSRNMRMRGQNVLHPMGWDAFGLPAENYAIKSGISPQKAVEQNVQNFKRQLMQMGFSYDWSREINSTDPSYYKWTQWLFLLLFKKGLAYQKESLQWWCPHDKTVLANEQVENGRCWRCGHLVEKKALKQWFFKITEYADRLEKDLDKVDWSEAIKSMQRNWIGRSEGAEIDFEVDGSEEKIKVFTTRPDTIFGATFMVLAPEHELVDKLSISTKRQEVEKYVKEAERKSDIDRMETEREKTGVFTGAYAINPATKEKIPIWVADYVLPGYGTGAIMAVPAHDARDYEFAKKFQLDVTPVVARVFGEELPDSQNVEGVVVIGYDPSTSKYLSLINNKQKETWLVGGGRKENETFEEAASRELKEESGYGHVTQLIQLGDPVVSYYHNPIKKRNTRSIGYNYLAILDSSQLSKASQEGHESFSVQWLEWDQLVKEIASTNSSYGAEHWIESLDRAASYVHYYHRGEDFRATYTGEGVLINSDKYDGLPTQEARQRITADLGKKITNYKIRDWLISRQRYWGAPIPIIHCKEHGAVPVPDDQLPVIIPEVESYEPSGDGRSPLANAPEFVNTTCPICGQPAQRETDTMDGFACSSWYFLRFADPHNDKEAFSREKADFWLPVDDYIGGAEHAVMHLLYARFWTKVMFDEGLIGFDEPFTKLRNHGMILAPDGQKMSKSKNNTIEPDGLIEQGYGADAIRLMELFIGPWNQAANWSLEGLAGMYRFLQRVWVLVQEFQEADKSADGRDPEGEVAVARQAHKAIKKVTADLEEFGFNTALAGIMESVNELYKLKSLESFARASDAWQTSLENLVQLLAPFAPHIAEELWKELGHETSVHISRWPEWDEGLIKDELVTIAVQVNGKVRSEIVVSANTSEAEALKIAQADAKIARLLEGKSLRKSIYVPGRLVSLVLE